MTDNRARSYQIGRKRLVIAIIGSGAACAAVAHAADSNDGSIVDALRSCAEIGDNENRLSCFDALAATTAPIPEETITLSKSSTAPPVSETDTLPSSATPQDVGDDYVVLKKEEAEELRRRAGVDDDYVVLPKDEAEELRRRADADKRAVKREPYESVIVRIFTTGYNTRNVVLENGETWRELKDAAGKKPRRGEKVRIAPATLGSWTVQYGGRSAKFKAKRIR